MSFSIAPRGPRRRRPTRLRKTGLVGLAVTFGLAFPASALAHTAIATVGCTGADLSFTQFAAGANTVNYKITVDDSPAVQGTFQLNLNGGREGALHVPLALHGTHSVMVFSWWGPANVVNGATRPIDSPAIASTMVTCPAAPPVIPPPPPPSPPAPAPAPAPPASGTAPTAPAGAVAGTEVRSATASVSAQRTCAAHSARVTVSGRQIRRVTFFVGGHRVQSVAMRAGQRSITVRLPLRGSGARRQTITARVSFRNGARPRTFTAHATRCPAAAVSPQFTG